MFIAGSASCQTGPKAVLIQNLPWTEAKRYLSDTTIVVIPLGAQAKEHGPHLQLNNDWLIAEYLRNRIANDQHVVIYPTINYHFYPAFLEYAGSTSIRLETAASVIVDICRVISAHGPKKFYVLNTGVSTLAALKLSRESLAFQGIMLSYTDILQVAGEAEKKIKQQTAGTHADEIETSMLLYIAPQTVDMSKAAKDIPVIDGPGPLTLDPNNPLGRYSPTGIYGDATLATVEKGKVVVEAMVAGINKEINTLRHSSIPEATTGPKRQLMEGLYILSNGEKLMLKLENDVLTMRGKGDRSYKLIRQGPEAFTVGERGRIVFFKDEKGQYSTICLNWEGIDYLGKR